MATSHEVNQQFHSGEDQMHKLLRVPDRDNPTSPFLTPHANRLLMKSPLLALGTLDENDWPWTTIWGGERGFSRAIGQSVIGAKATVDRKYDPVFKALFGQAADGDIVRPEDPGNMVSGVGLDLEDRDRVKLYGRMVGGAVSGTEKDIGEAQLVLTIEQSLGNCPKYLNKKQIMLSVPSPKLISDSLPLPQVAVDLLAKADMFCISSSNYESDMDTNHRGGPPGFVRLLSNKEDDCTLVYPEYSGNRLYQTLGNLVNTPRVGLVFPDFDSGNVLYITGTTEILVREDANKLLPRSNMVVKIKVKAARFVETGLGFRGIPGELSPYNPRVRLLPNEQSHELSDNAKQIYASLVEKKILTPTIARFRFNIADPDQASRWKPGQYVALSFQDELDMGYSHMRDSDPQSLNDDFLRTFTVSSGPGEASSYDHFDITIRKVGHVTDFLFRHNTRSTLKVPLKGFGGEFIFQQDPEEQIGCIAGGIGITPLLAQASVLDLSRVHLYWTVRAGDLGLVVDSFEHFPALVGCVRLFVTGTVNNDAQKHLKQLGDIKALVEVRRIRKTDLRLEAENGVEIMRWYVCTGNALKKTVDEWLKGRLVITESFDY